MIDTIGDVIYSNGMFYVFILISIVASFTASLLITVIKSYQMIKNGYFTYLFEKDLWSHSLEKNIDNAKKWESKSTLVKMFSSGFQVFMTNYKKDKDYNSGSKIHLTKNTMKVILLKDLEYFQQGFNLLSFNSVFIPYATLSLASWNIIEIFQSFDIGILTLTMFVKPLTVITLGVILTGISSILYLSFNNRLDVEAAKAELFIEEFGNFLHRNFYNKEN